MIFDRVEAAEPFGYLDCEDGSRFWFRGGYHIKHREDGPAVEYSNGNKEWWYMGEKLNCHSQKEFESYLKNKVFW